MNANTQQIVYFVYDQYQTKLTDLLTPLLYEGFGTIWQRVKEKYESTWTKKTVYEKFQKKIQNIQDWNATDVHTEGKRVLDKLNCNYIEKLIEKVFLLKAQILSTVKDNATNQKIKVVIPSFDNFIHHCYISTAKELVLHPQWMEDRDSYVSYDDRLNNIKLVHDLIRSGILTAVRDLLPLDQLLSDESSSGASRDSTHEKNVELQTPLQKLGGTEISHKEDVPIITTPANNIQDETLDPFEKELLRR